MAAHVRVWVPNVGLWSMKRMPSAPCGNTMRYEVGTSLNYVLGGVGAGEHTHTLYWLQVVVPIILSEHCLSVGYLLWTGCLWPDGFLQTQVLGTPFRTVCLYGEISGCKPVGRSQVFSSLLGLDRQLRFRSNRSFATHRFMPPSNDKWSPKVVSKM